MTASDQADALSGVSLKPLTPEHVTSFWRALDTVARERRYLTLLEAPPLPDMREFVLSSTKSGNPHFVAIANSEVVGWCDVRRHFFPAHAHRGTLGMGIIPAYRGQGLGLRLLSATLEAAFDAGLVRIEFDVHADNARAIALYRKVGFTQEGVLRDAVFIEGKYRDAITMALVRRESSTEVQNS